MKRLLFFILAFCMLLSAYSCTPALVLETETETGDENGGNLIDTITKEELVIPQGYSAGYARADVTPTRFPQPMSSTTTAVRVRDKIYLSCVAISDGDEVALLIHMDLKGCPENLYSSVTRIIEQETGVPADHVFLNATHTHNVPLNSSDNGNVIVWMRETLYPAFRKVAKKACQDLAPAEMYIGRADTTHYAHVRRYICEDGTVNGINLSYTTGSPIKQHESLADPELQVIQFRRTVPKKDIVMVNWQAHAAHAHGSNADYITSDFVHYLRQDTELLTGSHFAYYNGASGNINLASKMPGLQKYTWTTVGQALALKVKEAVDSAEKVSMGEIKVAAGGYEGTYRTYSAQRIEEARISNRGTAAENEANRAKYKFQSRYEVSNIVGLADLGGKKHTIPLSAITFGDVAFAAASYEMFDTSGQQVKAAAASKYKMTFICAYTNGSNGYMPTEFSYSQGGYETDVCKFVSGTAEKCVEELIRLLNAAA